MSLITLGLIVGGFLSFLTILVAFAPTVEQYPLPDWMASATGTIIGYIHVFSVIFPTAATALLRAFVWMMIVGVVMAVWSTIRYFINLGRGAHV